MKNSQNLSFSHFSDSTFLQFFKATATSSQEKYLLEYLKTLQTKSFVIEKMYVDRHFIEEYQKYYSINLRHMENKCERYHFFDIKLTQKIFQGFLFNDLNSVKNLNDHYLGFIVKRPVKTKSIGRTVLCTLNKKLNSSQRFFATTKYKVHISGTRLVAQGLAFQQQDQAVGACATTAIWTSLQKINKDNGRRAMTPLEITESATKYFLTQKAFPANNGLHLSQMYEAVRSAGYIPHWVNGSNFSFFKMLLKVNLDSGFPTILIIRNMENNAGHAVCALGYNSEKTPVSYLKHNGAGLDFLIQDFHKIYIHDDRLGPYARAQLEPNFDKIAISIDLPDGNTEKSNVDGFMVPLYSKIRTYDSDLNKKLIEFTAILKESLKISGIAFPNSYITQSLFAMSGEVLRNISLEPKLPSKEKFRFLKKIKLSRYVGVSTVMNSYSVPLFKVLFDSTDFYKGDNFEGILGIVCYQDYLRAFLKPLEKRGHITIL